MTELDPTAKAPTKAKLVLMRHGQTDYNAKHIMTGQLDIPLNAEGERQATGAGALIKDIHFDKAYSSSLSRAFNTAALALKAAGQDIAIEKRDELIEMNNGDYTGHNRVDDPVVANWVIVYDKPWPNGESTKDVVDRVKAFFDAEVLPRLERGENVFIAAHSVVLAAFDIALGASLPPEPKTLGGREKRVLNATPVVYDYEDGVLKAVSRIENPATTAANQNDPHVQEKAAPKRRQNGPRP